MTLVSLTFKLLPNDISHFSIWTEPKVEETSTILKCPNLERNPALVCKEKIKFVIAPLMVRERIEKQKLRRHMANAIISPTEKS